MNLIEGPAVVQIAVFIAQCLVHIQIKNILFVLQRAYFFVPLFDFGIIENRIRSDFPRA